jgi:hypothetical protein
MTHKVRFTLFLFFIFLFFIIAPISVFYAAGYTINLTWPLKFSNAIQKMGMFVFDTTPEGAKIYIDNEPVLPFLDKFLGNKSFLATPTKIKNIKPGNYQIKFEKDGYWPWEKQLEIISGKATNAEDVFLFKKSEPKIVASGLEDAYLLSPDEKFAINYSNKAIAIINLIDHSVNKISSSSSQELTWSADSRSFISGRKIFSTNGQPLSAANIEIASTSKIQYFDNSDGLIIYQENNYLKSLSLKNGDKKILLETDKVQEISRYNNQLECLIEVGGKNKISSLDYNSLITKNEVILPPSDGYKIIKNEKNLILSDQKNKIIYFFDLNSADNKLLKTLNNAKFFTGGSDNRFAYANDFEIWLYDQKNNQQTLLARISDLINSIYWHESNNYIFYSTDKNINILELDDREKRNITELLSGENIKNVIINSNGLITFFGSINNLSGWYNLEF